jgi:hypothetical protein
MLKRPLVNKPASSSPNLEQANELVAVFNKMQTILAEMDQQIETLTRTVDMLTQQVSNSREKASLPEFVLEVSGHDMNGRIKTVTAKPRRT